MVNDDKNNIVAAHPQWEKYDGEFRFEYKFKSSKKDHYLSKAKILTSLQNQIAKAYPGEPFVLEDSGGGDREILVNVICSTSLKNKFKLFPFDWEWSPFGLNLTTYSFQKLAATRPKR